VIRRTALSNTRWNWQIGTKPTSALYCVETHRYGEPALSSTEIVLERLEEEGAAMLAELADRADNVGIDWTSTVCHGLPWEEIHEKADEVDADLIVLGYQGQSHQRSSKIGERRRTGRSTRRSAGVDRLMSPTAAAVGFPAATAVIERPGSGGVAPANCRYDRARVLAQIHDRSPNFESQIVWDVSSTRSP